MSKETKYPGIAAGSYGEKAIDIVVEVKSILGPELAARLGFSVYEMSNLRRAVQLGYLQKSRSTGQGSGTPNIYTIGEKLKDACKSGEPLSLTDAGKSMTHILLEHIAKHGKLTSLVLAGLVDSTPGQVSACLHNYTKNGVVRVRSVPCEGNPQRKLINEYSGADLERYRANHVRGGHREPIESQAGDSPQNLVPPRTAPEFRPLNLSKLGTAPQREGAWEFRDIPSVYARNTCA